MNDTRVPTFLYVFLLLLGLLQWAHVYPQLPDIMASHFSGHGTPNNWQPKQAFFLLMGVVVLISAIPTFVVPRRLASMPEDKIDLPNKSYWLAPERREDTFRFVRVKMAWFGCALLFLLFYATSEAINANLPNIGHFNWRGMWFALGGFLVFTVVWLVQFLRHFYNVPKPEYSSQPR
jgi:uncharacterized membrane protein